MSNKPIHRHTTQKAPFSSNTSQIFTPIDIKPLFPVLPPATRAILNNFDALVQDILPLNAKQLQQLPDNIRELSLSLTSERSSRRVGYLNETKQLSAYVRYFSWWNLVRFVPLFASFPENAFAPLADGSFLLDIGSGPLTVPIALWLAHPELRTKSLTWYCLDISQNALSFGEELFTKIVAQTAKDTPEQTPWRIIRVKGEAGTAIRSKASFITCANMFNEQYWNSSRPLEEVAKRDSELLLSYAAPNATILLIEPGIPRAARFISLMRSAFIRKSLSVLAPCPHSGDCPMEGKKGGKWCHFVLSTEHAPKNLHKLSEKAGLPKDRASLSFCLATRGTQATGTAQTASAGHAAGQTENTARATRADKPETTTLRIVSDPIRLGETTIGRYSCSALGLTLALAPETAFSSGDAVTITASPEALAALPTDYKSGAKKIRLQ